MGLLFAKTTREPVDRRRSLQSIPALNPGIRLEREDEGKLLVIVPIERGRGFLARFRPAVFDKKVRLDSIGAFVLAQVDSRHTVQDIIEAFVNRYHTNRREAELSTAQFLKSLAERRVISIGVR